MTFVVPFDGSPLAQAALSRAVAFAGVTDEDVVAVTVIPHGNATYAREKGWLIAEEPFDRDTVVDRLRRRVADLAPDATLRPEFVDKRAPSGTISTKVRRALRDEDTTMVFVGSDNAGRVAASVASVGGGITGSQAYDVVIVRSPGPSPVTAIHEQEPLARRERDPETADGH
jgi:nucleotide-binding universal stress UspA family protein